MLPSFFQKRPTPNDPPSQLRDLVLVILASGLVTVAIVDKDYRQPLCIVAGSVLSANFIIKKLDSKQ